MEKGNEKMEINEEKIQEIKNKYEELGKLLNELHTENDNYDWHRRLRVLAEVMKVGGVVTQNQWGNIGATQGYDRRGLGGFFAGKNSTMKKLFQDKNSITDEGIAQAEAFIQGNHFSGATPTKQDLDNYEKAIQEFKNNTFLGYEATKLAF